MTRTLFLILGLFAAVAAYPDSLIRVRDSLLAELQRTSQADYARTKEISEKLNALEKAAPVQPDRAENTDKPPSDLFQLQALEVVLQARMKKCETQRDSLMGLLTELHFRREGDNAFPEARNGRLGVDPRDNVREAPAGKNPDTEKLKARTVQRIDSLKIEIKSLKRQMESNRVLIQSQLKGGQP